MIPYRHLLRSYRQLTSRNTSAKTGEPTPPPPPGKNQKTTKPKTKKRIQESTDMPITILQPAPIAPRTNYRSDSDSDDDGGADLEGDISMMGSRKRARQADDGIVTPGEVITTDPQWMRYVALSNPSSLFPLQPSSSTQRATR